MLNIKRILIKDHLSAPLRYLYSHTILKGLASGLLGFFVPLFLFGVFGDIKKVILYYLVVHMMTLLLRPWATKMILRFDLKKLMIVATFFIGLYLIVLNQFKTEEINFYLIAIAVMLITIYRLIYWVPYHTEFATFTEKQYRGRELGMVHAIVSLLGIALPAISAFIIVKFGFNWLFIMALVLHVLSTIPLFKIPSKYEEYSYGYFETWRELFSKKNRGLLLAYFSDGFQSAAGYVIWPIFIFLLLNGEYLSVGIISTLIILVTVVLRLVMGDITDHKNKKHLLKYGSVIHALGWLIRVFVENGFQIFAIGVYHGFSEILMRTPFDTLMYERAADREHYIDEYTSLREMAIRLGKISLLLFAFITVGLVGLNWIFVVVAFIALLVNFV